MKLGMRKVSDLVSTAMARSCAYLGVKAIASFCADKRNFKKCSCEHCRSGRLFCGLRASRLVLEMLAQELADLAKTLENRVEKKGLVRIGPSAPHARAGARFCRAHFRWRIGHTLRRTPRRPQLTTTASRQNGMFLPTCCPHSKVKLINSIPSGSLRSNQHRRRKVCSRPRQLPPRLLQEHPRDRPGHQRLETRARPHLPRQCLGAQGGHSHEAVRRLHWTHCSG